MMSYLLDAIWGDLPKVLFDDLFANIISSFNNASVKSFQFSATAMTRIASKVRVHNHHILSEFPVVNFMASIYCEILPLSTNVISLADKTPVCVDIYIKRGIKSHLVVKNFSRGYKGLSFCNANAMLYRLKMWPPTLTTEYVHIKSIMFNILFRSYSPCQVHEGAVTTGASSVHLYLMRKSVNIYTQVPV